MVELGHILEVIYSAPAVHLFVGFRDEGDEEVQKNDYIENDDEEPDKPG